MSALARKAEPISTPETFDRQLIENALASSDLNHKILGLCYLIDNDDSIDLSEEEYVRKYGKFVEAIAKVSAFRAIQAVYHNYAAEGGMTLEAQINYIAPLIGRALDEDNSIDQLLHIAEDYLSVRCNNKLRLAQEIPALLKAKHRSTPTEAVGIATRWVNDRASNSLLGELGSQFLQRHRRTAPGAAAAPRKG